MIFEDLNFWFVGLGVAIGAINFLIILILVYKYRKKSIKEDSEIHKKEDKDNYEEFNGIFLPLTEINHYRYYYRY
jgi:hypothetical protein